MKKQTVSLLVLLLAASGLFFSCGNTVNKNAYALEFDSIQVNETVHLFGDTAKPACNLILNVAYASQSSDVRLKDSLNTFFLSACFGDKYMAMTPEEAVKKYTEKYVGDYRNDLEPMYKKDEEDKQDEQSIGAWYSYYKRNRKPCAVVQYLNTDLPYRLQRIYRRRTRHLYVHLPQPRPKDPKPHPPRRPL